jgi:alpha-L-fucosidase
MTLFALAAMAVFAPGPVAAPAPMVALGPIAAPTPTADTSVMATSESATLAPPSRDERMAWWRNARFGLFIHWGLYSTAAGEWQGKPAAGAGEWLLTNARADPAEYRRELLPAFTAEKFDARAWAELARDAGMQYVVITTKHHDGFCLWPSDLTDYDTASTPFRRDVMRELSDAVRAAGLRMGWYHSIMDWTHPDYLPRRSWDPRPAEGADMERYVAYMHGQLRELLTRYGPVDVMWFDGEWEPTWNHALGARTDDLVRSLQPQVIVNNRVDVGRAGMGGFTADETARGDFGTPEQTIPANGLPGKDWETCMTMNDTWGYKASDHNWKSSRTLIRMLCDIASKGGNFLLNVGPKGDGTIPEESVQRLMDIGAWLRVHGQAIYGTQASPFARPQAWGRVTQARRGDQTSLYLMVFDWPANGVLRVAGLESKPTGALLLHAGEGGVPGVGGGTGTAAGSPLRLERDGSDVLVHVPARAPNDDCSVVELRVPGTPSVAEWFIGPAADGRVVCSARDAMVEGGLAYEPRTDNLGFWLDRTARAGWTIKVPKAGRYRVELEYAAQPGTGGEAELRLAPRAGTAPPTAMRAAVPPRSSWTDFTRVTVGEADIPGDTLVTVAVQATTMPGEAFINLRSVLLVPVGP